VYILSFQILLNQTFFHLLFPDVKNS